MLNFIANLCYEYGIAIMILVTCAFVLQFVSIFHPYLFLKKFFVTKLVKKEAIGEDGLDPNRHVLLIANILTIIILGCLFFVPFALLITASTLLSDKKSLGAVYGTTLLFGFISCVLFLMLIMVMMHPIRKHFDDKLVLFCKAGMLSSILIMTLLMGYERTPFQFYSFSIACLTINFFCLIYVAYAGQPNIELKKLLKVLFTEKDDDNTEAVEEIEGEEKKDDADTKNNKRSEWRGYVRPNSIPLLIAYGLSLLVLLCYSLSFFFMIDKASGNAKWTGFIVSLSILWYDYFIFLLKQKRFLRSDPETILITQFMCRAVLIAFGQDFWFLGQCLLYFIFTAFLGRSMVESFYPHEGMSARIRAFEDASDFVLSDGKIKPKKEDENLKFYMKRFGANFLLYLLCSVMFLVVFILVAADVLWAPRVFVIDKSQKQFVFGFVALIGSIVGLLGYATWRCFTRGTELGTTTRPFHMLMLIIQATLFIGASAGGGGLVYGLTKSVYILSSAIFIPFIMITFFIFVRIWRLNHYSFFQANIRDTAMVTDDPVKHTDVVPNIPSEKSKSKNNDDDDNNNESKENDELKETSDNNESKENDDVEKQSNNDENNKNNKSTNDESKSIITTFKEYMTPTRKYNLMVISILFLLASLTASYGSWIYAVESKLVGLSIIFVPMILFFTAIPIVKFMKLEIIDQTALVCGILSFIFLVTFASITGDEMANKLDFTKNEQSLALVFILLAYPSIVSAIIALSLFQSNKMEPTKPVLILFGIAIVLILSFDITVTIVYDIYIGIGLIVLLLLFIYLLIAAHMWYKNDFRLPKKVEYSLVIIFGIIIFAGVLLGLISKDGFIGFSIAWCVLCSALCLYSLNQLVNTSKTYSAFSPHFYPVYKFEIDTSSIKPKNKAATAGLCGLFGFIMYGALASFYLSHPAVGVAISCASLSLIMGMYLYFIHQGSFQLAMTSEFLTKDIAYGLKKKAFAKYSSSNEPDLEAGDNIYPEPEYPGKKAIVDEKLIELNEVKDVKMYEKLYLKYLIAEIEMFNANDNDTNFDMYYSLLLTMAGKYLAQRMERDIVEFLAKNDLNGVTADDISHWNNDVLTKLKDELTKNRAAADERARIIDEQEKQASKGKRARINVECINTVFPLISDEDYVQVYKKVIDEIQAFKSIGNKFTDKEFEPYKVRNADENWKRPEETDNEAKVVVFDGDIEPSDLNQGALGDCWFIAAMANVSQRPEKIRELFLHNDDGEYKFTLDDCCDAGIYCIKLYQQGRWWAVIVDDRIPCNQWGTSFAFCKSRKDHCIEMWPTMLEKAYAKLFSSKNGYEQLEGGQSTVGMRDLTGMEGALYQHSPTSERVISGRLWSDIKRMYQSGFFIGASSAGESDSNVSSGNIVERHAFSLLGVAEIEGFKLMQLRNPWGCTEWTGDWSDNSPMWDKYPKVKKQLNVEVADDGIFWIAYEDYIRHFDGTGVTLFSKTGHITTKKIIFDECPSDYLEGGSFGKDMQHCPQAWLKVKKSVDLLIQVRTPPRRVPDPDDEKDRGDWLKVLCCQEGEYRIHSTRGYMLSVFDKQVASHLVYASASDKCYNLLAVWDKFSSRKQDHKNIFPLELHVQCRTEDAEFVTLMKTPTDATAKKAEGDNVFDIYRY